MERYALIVRSEAPSEGDLSRLYDLNAFPGSDQYGSDARVGIARQPPDGHVVHAADLGPLVVVHGPTER
jgi:hypothetical protein